MKGKVGCYVAKCYGEGAREGVCIRRATLRPEKLFKAP